MSSNFERVGLKQFRSDGCLSYLLFDRTAREGILIDPLLDLMEDYREFVASERLRLISTVDTHTHADHPSATQELHSEMGVPIAMGAGTRSARATLKLADGQKIKTGSLEIEVLETPGHTPDSLCLFEPEARLVFTGDTLFAGSTGRTDFPGSDPAQQWDSLQKLLTRLPADTLVMPGHDYSGLICSTLEVEKKRNAHLLLPGRDAFVAMKGAECVAQNRDEVRQLIEFNLSAGRAQGAGAKSAGTACGAALPDSDRVMSINIEKFRNKLEEGSSSTAFVDVREPSEFVEGHIPGSKNIPLSEIGLKLRELSRFSRVYVNCLTGRRSIMAVKTLNYLGIADAVNVNGGFQAWTQSGFPVEKSG